MATEKLNIVVTLKDRVTRGLKLVGKSLDVLRTGISRVKSAVFSLQGAFLAFGAGMIARGFLAVAMSFEKFESILTTITGSAAKAKESMKWITDFTAKTPYELTEVTDSFVKLVAYGFDPTIKVLKVLGDTAAAMGKPLEMAVEMFADAATGEFERLKTFGIRAKQQGDTVTFSWVENGKEMVKTAKKTQAGITDALIDILKRYDGAMNKLSETVGGMWSNLADQFTIFQKTVMDAGIFDHIKAGLSLILEKINQLEKEGKLKKWAEEVSAKVISSLKFMVFGMISVYEVFGPIMKNFQKLFSGLWDWFKGLDPWVQTSGLVLAIMGGKNVKLTLLVLAAMGKGVKELQDEIRLMTYEWDEGRSKLENYLLKLEALKIVREKLSKASIFGESDEEFKERIEKLKDINEQIIITENLIRQLTPYKIFDKDKEAVDINAIRAAATKFFDDIEERRKKLADAKPFEPPPPSPVVEAKKIVPIDLETEIKKQLLSLEVLYQSGEEELVAYLERRKALVLLALGAEMGELRAAAEAEEDVSKRLKIEEQLFIKKQEYALKEIELTKNITQAHEDATARKIELEDILKDLKERAALETGTELESAHALELAELDRRQQEEMQRIMDLTEFMEDEEKKRSTIKQAYRDQELEKDKLLETQKRALWTQRLDNAQNIAGGLADIFQDMYELGDKKSKEMFELQKKAAIAEAIISTAKAVAGALGTPPYGLAAIANAAIIAIKGGLQIAKIKAQEMAEGGLVEGSSPHSKSDNISVKGTAGEFMQPVSAVKHLGLKVMEGIRKNVFPRELFEGFNLPAYARATAGSGYAEGGQISGGDSNFSVSVPVNIDDSRATGIAGMLQDEVEQTVIRVMERELR